MAMYLRNKRFRLTARFPHDDFQFIRFAAYKLYGDCPSDALRGMVYSARMELLKEPAWAEQFKAYCDSHPLEDTVAETDSADD